MASNDQTAIKDEKGYDHKFVDPVPNELLCLICLLAARDPQQSICCGKVFCKACVDELKKHSNKCPGCRGDMNCFPDKRSDRNIKEMKIKCDNANNGCEWIGELCSVDKHLIVCDYTFLSCPNECEDDNKILRRDMEKHKTEECPRRQYVCSHCEESGEYQERTTTHLEKCPLLKIPCSSNGCSELVARRDMLAHLCNKCEFQVVSCKYALLGCEVEVRRKELEKHEADREQHLDLVINAVPEHADAIKSIKACDLPKLQDDVVAINKEQVTLQKMVEHQKSMLAHMKTFILVQNQEINELKLKLKKLESALPSLDRWIPGLSPQITPPPQLKLPSQTSQTTSPPQLKLPSKTTRPPQLKPQNSTSIQDLNVFKFTDFAERKSSNASVFSPPIYSSPGGYKIGINVRPNGSGKGKGTHISVFPYLMRGENDDHLAWPFIGTVVVELLNQLADGNHHSTSIIMTKVQDTSQRVLDGDAAKDGYGRPCYIAHSSLDCNPVKKCQYLKNDCLYFRVKIKSAVTSKPWLSCAEVF